MRPGEAQVTIRIDTTALNRTSEAFRRAADAIGTLAQEHDIMSIANTIDPFDSNATKAGDTIDIDAIMAVGTDDMDPYDEELEEYTVVQATYDVTMSTDVSLGGYSTSVEGEAFTMTVHTDDWDDNLDVELEAIYDQSSSYFDTWDFDQTDDYEDDDAGHVIRKTYRKYESATLGFDDDVQVEATLDIDVQRIDGPERVFKHEVDMHCECPVCEARRPIQHVINGINNAITSITTGVGMAFGPFVWDPENSNQIRVKSTDDPETLGIVANVDKVSGQNVRLVSPYSERQYEHPYMDENTKVAASNVTLRQLRGLFMDAVRKAYKESPVAVRKVGETYASGEIVFYKVTGRNGEASSGGSFTYDLPTSDGPGEWTPLIEETYMCNRGYHITTNPMKWTKMDSRYWTVEFDGASGFMEDDKVVCRSIRLVREVQPTDLYPVLGKAMMAYREDVAPVIEKLAKINTLKTLEDLPEYAVLSKGLDLNSWTTDISYRASFSGEMTDQDMRPQDISRLVRDTAYRDAGSLSIGSFVNSEKIASIADLVVLVRCAPRYFSHLDVLRASAMLDCLNRGYIPSGVQVPFGKLVVYPITD